ncbi:MAG: iron export ABC transporter permease subunit FetB [Acidimicrobiales bacterium]|nr:iron export ABC transporter permease subunit FetB [Acidimicrobiales bacterium]
MGDPRHGTASTTGPSRRDRDRWPDRPAGGRTRGAGPARAGGRPVPDRAGDVNGADVGFTGVAASLILILIAVALSLREHLGLGRSILWASTRALAQMLVIGAGLGLVLADGAPIALSWLWVVAMVLIGAVTVASRVKEVPGTLVIALASLGVAQFVSLFVIFAFGILPLEPRTLVPGAGMIMGNAIGATVLAARRTFTEVSEHRDQVEVRLSLGEPATVALRPHLTEALRTSITPQVEQTKIVGIVALPGTMTGLLLAGVDPIDAVLAQTAVMFLILGSVAITCVLVGRGVARRLVTRDHRLVPVDP